MNVLIVSTFAAILANFSTCFSEPTFVTFKVLMQGWLLCTGRRTVTRVLSAGDGLCRRSFASYHRFFSRAQWQVDELGRVILRLALKLVPPDEPLTVAVDDTLSRKSGKRIWGAAMHHDPLLSSGNKTAFSFGHNWVVLSLQVALPFLEGRRVALPILLRLYRKRLKPGRKPREEKSTGAAKAHSYRTRPQLAAEMIQLLASWLPDRTIHVVADPEYAGRSISRQLPENVHLTSRMIMNAALFAPAERRAGAIGRPRKKGKRLASPAQLARKRSGWRNASVNLYGKKLTVRYQRISALWYNSSGERLLTIVVVRDPRGNREDDCFFTTERGASAKRLLERIAARWPLEVTFRDAKQSLGLEDPQNRVAKATQRTAPMAFYGYSLIVIWFAEHGQFDLARYREQHPWYPQKRLPSFADMLESLRAQSLAEQLSSDPSRDAGSSKTRTRTSPKASAKSSRGMPGRRARTESRRGEAA